MFRRWNWSVNVSERCLPLLMEWPDGNYWNDSFVLQMAQLRWFLRVFQIKQLEGYWVFIILCFMCAALRRICFSLCLFGARRDGWRVITGLKSLLRWPSWEYKLCFDMFGIAAASRRLILDCDDFWLGTVQLGGRFWMEMSHCSSLWSVAMSSKAKTLHHLCTRD